MTPPRSQARRGSRHARRPGPPPGPGAGVGVRQSPPTKGPATDLREALRTGKGDLSDLPDAVGRYVLEHGLYGVCRWG